MNELLSLLALLGGLPQAQDAEPAGGVAEVNGTSLHYETMGSGPPLVLVSGGGTLDRRGWDGPFTAFAEFHHVIRYDLRGLGESARPRGPFSHSQDLRALLELLGIEKAHLLGLSFGAAIALDFALEHPEKVGRLVLASAGTSSDARGEANLDSLSALSAMVEEEGLPRAIERILETPFFLSTTNTAVREKVRRIYLENGDVFESDFPLVRLWQPAEPPASGRLSEIRAPVLILEGENDSPALKALSGPLSRIGGARKVVISGAGHVIHLDQPGPFIEAVLEFLSEKAR